MDGMSMSEGNRSGRPAIGKRGSFTFRVTPALRELLEAEAVMSQRSVSEVIEARLTASYDRQVMSAELLALAKSIKDA
jgi:predicted HicB family RNase H-like nuclease